MLVTMLIQPSFLLLLMGEALRVDLLKSLHNFQLFSEFKGSLKHTDLVPVVFGPVRCYQEMSQIECFSINEKSPGAVFTMFYLFAATNR